jgi:hypothetical protein
MGTKYEVSHLRKLAIARLRYMFPSDLGDFKHRHSDYKMDFGSGLQFTIAAMSLARTCSVPSIVPLCFLLNIWATASETMESRALCKEGVYTAEDGTVYRVSPEDSELCIIGAWKLAERQRQVFYASYKPTLCLSNFEGCQSYHLHGIGVDPQFTTPSNSAPASHIFTESPHKHVALCAQCLSEVDSSWKEEVSATWRALPSYFDLSPWEELLALE